MELLAVKLKNFRAWRDETSIPFKTLTAFVGRNDVGKSTVFEALGVFFGHELCKIDSGDRCVYAPAGAEVSITCVFVGFPEELVLDETSVTSLADERLLNADGHLEIKKSYIGDRMKEEVFAVAVHPTAEPANDLLQKKNAELKKIAESLKAQADYRSNTDLRRAIRNAVADLRPSLVSVPLNKEGAKEIWSALSSHMPLFALFRADRPSTDDDGEVQDPMRLAVRQAIAEVEPQLQEVRAHVERRALEVAQRTLEKLGEIDENLSSTLAPRFRSEPKWDSLFKLSLTGDHDIPVNKRGSGVRRLILLSFFQAEVERRRSSDSITDVIYAIEEPETSQHPSNQVAVVEALKELSESPGCQVLITTHVPALAGLLPIEGIRHVTKDSDLRRSIESGDRILRRIADDLGVLPDLHDGRVQIFVCVEGPTDVEFLRNISRVLCEHNSALPSVGTDPRIAVIPLGGGTLKSWVNKRYLRELGLPEAHIYDGDVDKYQEACEEVNARGDGSWATCTQKREIENYLHPLAIKLVLGVDVKIDDSCDVEELVAAALGKSKVKRRRIKNILNEDVAAAMSFKMLQERGGLEEIIGWYRKIGEHLH
ncbi:MAG TPA: ATP-binding protein [Thermoanaerobaculia bacterium]|nr:ATP-binding protein [Thermoanaerobaculia bacterium]